MSLFKDFIHKNTYIVIFYKNSFVNHCKLNSYTKHKTHFTLSFIFFKFAEILFLSSSIFLLTALSCFRFFFRSTWLSLFCFDSFYRCPNDIQC